MNTLDTNNIKWSENVIIADADYIDRVAFDLIVNFERMINRRIQPADMAQWAVCIALDGGLREGEHETQVVLIHDKQSMAMKNFRPANNAGSAITEKDVTIVDISIAKSWHTAGTREL